MKEICPPPGKKWCRRTQYLEPEDKPTCATEVADGHTDDSELNRHVKSQEVVDELEERPAATLHEPPCPRSKH